MKLVCLKCDRDLSRVPVLYGVLKCPECGARYSVFTGKDGPPIDNSQVPGIYGSGFYSTGGVNFISTANNPSLVKMGT